MKGLPIRQTRRYSVSLSILTAYINSTSQHRSERICVKLFHCMNTNSKKRKKCTCYNDCSRLLRDRNSTSTQHGSTRKLSLSCNSQRPMRAVNCLKRQHPGLTLRRESSVNTNVPETRRRSSEICTRKWLDIENADFATIFSSYPSKLCPQLRIHRISLCIKQEAFGLWN